MDEIMIELLQEDHFGGPCFALRLRKGNEVVVTAWMISDGRTEGGIAEKCAREMAGKIKAAMPDAPQKHVGFEVVS